VSSLILSLQLNSEHNSLAFNYVSAATAGEHQFYMYRLHLILKLALIIYDTILTLPREVDLLWGKRFRLAALLYIMARYVGMMVLLLDTILDTIQSTNEVFVVHPMRQIKHHPCCYWHHISVCDQIYHTAALSHVSN